VGKVMSPLETILGIAIFQFESSGGLREFLVLTDLSTSTGF
jgi:hypothetical protein